MPVSNVQLGRLFLVSHSALDIVSILDAFERHRGEREVTILISSTPENLQFFQGLDLPATALRYLDFGSRRAGSRKRLVRYLGMLLAERRLLDELAAEIASDNRNELVFHSYDSDLHTGYLVARVADTNRVTLVDVLGVKPKSLRANDLLSWFGLKNIVDFVLATLIFGRHYLLSGTLSSPHISLDLSQIKLDREVGISEVVKLPPARYRFPLNTKGKDVVLLYADRYGVGIEHHISVYRCVLDCLTGAGTTIHLKIHPQSRTPAFITDYDVQLIPRHIPFEFIELTKVSLVVGIAGASLLHPGARKLVSVLKLLYPADSDLYGSALMQTGRNSSIIYVSTVDELKKMISETV
jgi:hypothetical protein